MNSNILPKRRTVSEGKDKVTSNTQKRRSDSPRWNRDSGQRLSPRNQSPLASPNNTPPASRSQSPQSSPGTSQSEKFFPEVSDSVEGLHETSVVDITSKDNVRKDLDDPSTTETLEEPSGADAVKSNRRSLKSCPCGKSSGGKSWLLNCIGCGQSWHNTCSNLKGQIPKSIIASLDHWLCPWCFVCPYEPPKGHKSTKQNMALTTTVISDSIVTQIEEAVKSCTSTQNEELVRSIQTSLNTLTGEVKSFKGQIKTINPTNFQDNIANIHIQSIIDNVDDVIDVPTPQQPFSSYKPDFVSEEYAQELKTYLDQETFISEGKRGVVCYGEKYKYMGSKSSGTKPVPDVFQPLLEQLNENIGYKLNQILVNKYTGPDAPLPKHSDNEYDINPDSEIYTVSIGDTATVKFTSKMPSENLELPVENRSLYSMSRSSQNSFKHHIDPDPNNSIRYSITVRSVHWTYLNSLYAVGDSNFGKIQFGEGKGKVGKATPGKRDWAATVSDIVPSKCMSYKNVVTMVGTNDLKLPECDVMNTYQKYKGKLEQIRELNPHCNIHVCPVLPSRSQTINNRIFQFNRLLFDDLVNCNININLVRGLGEFLDRGNLLRSALHDQRTNEDVLHINGQGYRILVRCIKHTIFSSKTKAKSTGRTYATSVARPS